MAEIILYLTRADAERIRDWINEAPEVAWIVEAGREGRTYTWRAVDRIDTIPPREYCIWHKTGGRLTIPAGTAVLADADVLDPYQGWTQTLDRDDASTPWFGANLPGPYTFSFKETGRSPAGSLGRSGFHWAGDHFSVIGKPAHPEAKKWWEQLRRFIKAHSTSIPWPIGSTSRRARAYAFVEAYSQIRGGRSVDDNP